jgi:hypothetical protein
MGAIGAALLAHEHMADGDQTCRFRGFAVCGSEEVRVGAECRGGGKGVLSGGKPD